MDGTGSLASLQPVIPRTDPAFDERTTDWTLKVRVPENVRPWMVPKGSVAIEGISLTIADWDGEEITIAILPLTYWRTNLHTLAPGAPVNVEADVLVKAGLRTDAQQPRSQNRDLGHPKRILLRSDRGLAGGQRVLSRILHHLGQFPTLWGEVCSIATTLPAVLAEIH